MPAPDAQSELDPAAVQDAIIVSVLSVVWTVAASIAAVAIGVRSSTTVLIAFGAIGAVDALGSVVLVYHFLRGLRHDRLSEDVERIAHRVVLAGLFSVGCLAVLAGTARLITDDGGAPSVAGVALAAASAVVLSVISWRKQRVAMRVVSPALRSDGHLSAIGAAQAAVTLGGIAAAGVLGWHRADPAATALVGAIAVVVAVRTRREQL